MANENVEQQKILKVFKFIDMLDQGYGVRLEECAAKLNVSTATIYRYKALVTALEYNLEEVEKNKYRLANSKKERDLSQEEKKYIASIVNAKDVKTKKDQAILYKLKSGNNIPSPIAIDYARKIRLIEHITFAIEYKSLIRLIKYESTEIEEARDRDIIAVDFNEATLALLGYDIAKNGYRVFKLQRMKNIEFLDKDQIGLPQLPVSSKFDAFGWHSNDTYKIELLLSKRAAHILKEEYPTLLDQISSTRDKNYPFRLRCAVAGYEAVGRFILGLCTEIKVVNDSGLKKYIENKQKAATVLTS
jgi:predicted DNA-binding transcriptional regulator YafY